MKQRPRSKTSMPDAYVGQWQVNKQSDAPRSGRLKSVDITPGTLATSKVLMRYQARGRWLCHYRGEVFSVYSGQLALHAAGPDPENPLGSGCADEQRALLSTDTEGDSMTLRTTTSPQGSTVNLRRPTR